jgi:hypothetical protein
LFCRDKAIPGTHGLSVSAGPCAGRGEATGAVVHHSVTAPGGSQKDGAVAAALLLGHLEAGARPRPAETIEDRPRARVSSWSHHMPALCEMQVV